MNRRIGFMAADPVPAPVACADEPVDSLWRAGMRRLRRNRMAIFALVVLVCMHVAAVFADFLGPYDEGKTNRAKFSHPPTRIHFIDEHGRLSRPFVYNYVQPYPGSARYEEDPAQGKFYIKLFYRGEPYKLLWLIPTNTRLFGVDQPAVVYLLGADRLGRDVFSRLLHGARKSLFVGLAGIFISTGLGLVYGGISGYYGGRVDNILMRLAEILLSIPTFYLLIALGAVLPTNVPSSLRYFLIVCILSFVSWAGISRVIRGMVLSIRQHDFVVGAQAVGAGTARIISRHILPNTLSYVAVNMTLQVPGYILGESALSFLGLGVQEPEASWGNMLSEATNLIAMTEYPWILTPGLAIFLAVLCWSFLGDGVRDAFDPRE